MAASIPADPVLDTARLVRSLAVSAAALIALGLLAFVGIGSDPLVSLGFHATALVGLATVLAVNQAGHSRLAGSLMVALFWLLFGAAGLALDGVHGSSMAGFFLVILAAALLLGSRAAVAVALLSSFYGLGLVALEGAGRLPEPVVRLTPAFEGVGWAIYFGMAAVLTRATASRYRMALDQAHRNAARQQRTLQALRDATVSKEFVEDVIRSMGDAVFVLDPAGRVLGTNPAAERMLGIDAAQLLGQRHEDLLVPGASDLPEEFSRVAGIKAVYATSAGDRVHASLSMATLRDADGQPSGLVCIARDVTAQSQLEARLRDASVRAEAASAEKSRFLAIVSHELRTPLNAIMGYTELLLEDLGSTESAVGTDLGRIRTASHGLLDLIDEVLDLSKIEAGRMEVERRAFQLAPVLEGVVHTVAPLIAANGNTLRLDVSGCTVSVVTDEVRVRQVVTNLLSNAAKFTQFGEIRLRARVLEGWLTVEVRDNGIGMSQEQLGRIFDAFTQADGSTTRRHGGTGLGLTISRRLCTLLGGSIEVRSEVGVGSTFTVRLPIEG